MIDRLGDLYSDYEEESSNGKNQTENNEMETNIFNNKDFDNFTENVERIETMIKECKKLIKTLQKELKKTKPLVIGHNKDRRDSEKSIIKQIKDTLGKIKQDLMVIKKENKELSQTTYKTMRLNIFEKVVKKYFDVFMEYKKIRKKCFAVLKKEEERTEQYNIFNSSQGQINIKKKSVKTVKCEFKIAEETKKELLQLESETNEIIDIFHDVLLLCNYQQDLLNSIENHVQNTHKNVEKGRKKIKQAIKLKKKKKKIHQFGY